MRNRHYGRVFAGALGLSLAAMHAGVEQERHARADVDGDTRTAPPSLLGPRRAHAQQTSESTGDWVSCYIEARNELLLGMNAAEKLCRGATSNAPVSCFERARRETVLTTNQVVTLCRCASSTAPAECFDRGREHTNLVPRKLVNMCAATTTRRLWPSCIPIAGTARDAYR
jgi:hypothetical protein